MEQLLEVYGIKPEVYDGFKHQLTLDENRILRINVNTASFQDLLKHPYDKARRLYHDRWLGFSESDLEDWFKQVNLQQIRVQVLEPDPHEPGYIPILASGRR